MLHHHIILVLLFDIISFDTLLTFITGGGIVKMLEWLSTKINSKKQADRDDFKELLLQYKTLYESSKKESEFFKEAEKNCEKRINEITKELSRINNQVNMLNHAQLTLPYPMWFKDTNFVMMYLNDEFEKQFLLPRKLCRADYIGKTDGQMWGEENVKQYHKSDIATLHGKKGFTFVEESIPESVGQFGSNWSVNKWVVTFNDTKIGVAGICLPK